MYGPLDFFDTLVATDWEYRFESFSDDEIWRLRRYDTLASELGQSSFFSQSIEFKVKASPLERSQALNHAGYDALRSMSMSLRQLWAAIEPSRFSTVRSLLRDRASVPRDGVDVTILLDLLGKRYNAAGRSIVMKEVWSDDPVGEPGSAIRARQVVDDWLNGGQFHGEREKMERVERWSPTAYEFTFVKAVHDIVAVRWELQIVVMGALGGLTAATV